MIFQYQVFSFLQSVQHLPIIFQQALVARMKKHTYQNAISDPMGYARIIILFFLISVNRYPDKQFGHRHCLSTPTPFLGFKLLIRMWIQEEDVWATISIYFDFIILYVIWPLGMQLMERLFVFILFTPSCPKKGLCQHDQPATSDPVEKHHQSDPPFSFQ